MKKHPKNKQVEYDNRKQVFENTSWDQCVQQEAESLPQKKEIGYKQLHLYFYSTEIMRM